MKKIILMGNNREINITSLEEVGNVNDIIKELIIPAFQASGFDPESIKDGLLSYIDDTSVCDMEDCNNDNTIKLCNTCFDEMLYRPEEHKKEVHLLKTELDITKKALDAAENVLMEIDITKKALDAAENVLMETEAKNNGNIQCKDCFNWFTDDEVFDDLCAGCHEDKEEMNESYKELWENEEVDVNRIPDNNVWTTGNQSTVQDGWVVPPADDEPVEPEQEEIPTPEPVVDETQTIEREKAIAGLEKVEELVRQGIYDPRLYEGTQLNCDNIKCIFPDIDCGDCSRCPVGIHSMEHSLTFGVFCCDRCKLHYNKPFPKEFCPYCGIHQNDDVDVSQNEFCGTHWDVNRKNDGYEANQDENWKDEDKNDNRGF